MGSSELQPLGQMHGADRDVTARPRRRWRRRGWGGVEVNSTDVTSGPATDSATEIMSLSAQERPWPAQVNWSPLAETVASARGKESEPMCG